MFISLLKDTNGHITGFVSHIKKRSMHKYPQDSLRQIPENDYKTLFYYLLGRDKVKEKGGAGSVKIGGLNLKDEGDHDKKHEKLQKDIFKFKRHPLN
jgi:hypothetical protein